MLLRMLVFICGACLMALEILGARVLAPVLGNSIFVWGALISSFMVAMSIGYWLGGLISERAAHLRMLGLAAAAGGLLAVLVPPAAAAVLPWAATLGPRLGPLVASLAAAMETAGGKNQRLRPATGAVTSRNRSRNSRAALGPRCIFQLAA
jgi:predicted membrane-bound spermidine synthase